MAKMGKFIGESGEAGVPRSREEREPDTGRLRTYACGIGRSLPALAGFAVERFPLHEALVALLGETRKAGHRHKRTDGALVQGRDVFLWDDQSDRMEGLVNAPRSLVSRLRRWALLPRWRLS